MVPKNVTQLMAADFVNFTVKEAFNDLAEEINAGNEFTVEANASRPANGFGRVSLVIRASNPSKRQTDFVFAFTVDASPYLDSARIFYQMGPVMVDGERKNSTSGDLVIPGAGLWSETTPKQVQDYVGPLAHDAMEGYRERQRILRVT